MVLVYEYPSYCTGVRPVRMAWAETEIPRGPRNLGDESYNFPDRRRGNGGDEQHGHCTAIASHPAKSGMI